MAVVSLNNNLSAQKAARALSESGLRVASASDRLSSGLRITKASDDPAGLSIADTLRVAAHVSAQGTRNLNDAISMFNIADSAVSELKNLSTRMSELAAQASNGTLSYRQRRPMDAEFSALMEEYNRIIDTTAFNGVSLFSSSNKTVDFQGGGSGISPDFGVTQVVGSATFSNAGSLGMSPGNLVIRDFDGDGIMDVIAGTAAGAGSDLAFCKGNGDGTFLAARTYEHSFTDGSNGVIAGDINGDGLLDAVVAGASAAAILFSNGDGSFKAPIISATPGGGPGCIDDFNNDGKADFIVSSAANVYAHLGNGDGTFAVKPWFQGGSLIVSGDFNEDGYKDLYVGQSNMKLGCGDGTFGGYISFSAIGTVSNLGGAVGDFNQDGHLDIVEFDYNGGANKFGVYLGNGDGTFRLSHSAPVTPNQVCGASTGDFNSDGILDLVSIELSGIIKTYLGNGDGTFSGLTTVSTSFGNFNVSVADYNNDGIDDIIGGSTSTLFRNGHTVSTVSLSSRKLGIAGLTGYSIISASDAREARTALRPHFEFLQRLSGVLGAAQSRLEHSVSLLGIQEQGSREAEGRIRDLDIAEETAALLTSSIRQRAGAAVLGQANQLPALALRLLQAGS